jgi:hypothetical protein
LAVLGGATLFATLPAQAQDWRRDPDWRERQVNREIRRDEWRREQWRREMIRREHARREWLCRTRGWCGSYYGPRYYEPNGLNFDFRFRN